MTAIRERSLLREAGDSIPGRLEMSHKNNAAGYLPKKGRIITRTFVWE
jgi:hypothetical protein